MVFACGCGPKPVGLLSRHAGPRGASDFLPSAVVRSEQGLSPASRLKKPGEFKAVFGKPFRSIDKQFIVLAKQNKLPRARLGLAIAKKRIPLAVGRNRVKRLIRESFRRNQKELRGLDIVVMAQDKLDQKQNPALAWALGKHWKKIARCAR